MKAGMWQVTSVALTIVFTIATAPRQAEAGWMDKLNAATQKLDRASQQMQQKSRQMTTGNAGQAKQFEKTKTILPITGDWGTQVSCAGPNSATCMNGMDDLMNCMHQSKGYFYRLIAADLEQKLADGTELSAEQRRDMETDLAAVRDAVATGKIVEPDPNNVQRWLRWATEEEHLEINRTNIQYAQEVRQDCNSRFSGMR